MTIYAIKAAGEWRIASRRPATVFTHLPPGYGTTVWVEVNSGALICGDGHETKSIELERT